MNSAQEQAPVGEPFGVRPGLLQLTYLRPYLWALVLLVVLRFVVAAVVPLSADEAYYWMWSRHLGAGYLDHPPAIAWMIRLGTALFGDNSFGVRFGPVLGSALATLFILRTTEDLTGVPYLAVIAALYFNLTLMVGVEMLAATPDAPALLASSALLWALARLQKSEDGCWWLAVGAIGGLALLSKFTAFFLAAGVLVWLIADRDARRWFRSPWLYAAIVLALAVDLPNLFWNAQHDFATYRFQFARVTEGHFTLRYLGEFLLAQLGLSSPFIAVLGAVGFARIARGPDNRLVACLLAPAVAYFLIHALHDRVQANWPSFLFPMFAVAAAVTLLNAESALLSISRKAAIPVAAGMLALVYAQACFGIIPLGRSDPLSRLLAVGFGDVATKVDAASANAHAQGLLVTDYESAAWFSFYARADQPIVDVLEKERWGWAPLANRRLLDGPLIYVAEIKSDKSEALHALFGSVQPLGEADRMRGGRLIARYRLYRVSEPTSAVGGWLVHGAHGA
jgi:4-amino-4-deoxy-L-arabinose transferase-like glycosyltransferase